MVARSSTACIAVFAAACAGVAYAPCPVELARAPTAADFPVARDLLMARYGALAIADETTFRLQTKWCEVRVPLGQRRATVFRDGDDLAVVVEFRALVEPVVGMPYWAAERGDAAAERDLADALAAELGGAGR